MKSVITTAAPVMHLPEKVKRFDFTTGYDPEEMKEFIKNGGWGIGGYNEKRGSMYLAPQYENRRNIHMGLDIWAAAAEPVFSALPGRVAYTAFHDQDGNYGGTVILHHKVDGEDLFALYGHLSLKSLTQSKPGNVVEGGDLIGWLGNEEENGNWPPHLHYQLSFIDPGKPDMPGVVSEEEREEALEVYPDPEEVLGAFV